VAEFKTAFGVLRVISTEGLGFGTTPLSAEGGVTIAVTDPREPFDVLNDLMVVVEALCPIWPPRDVVTPGPFKL
jgi:hypothetical protein